MPHRRVRIRRAAMVADVVGPDGRSSTVTTTLTPSEVRTLNHRMGRANNDYAKAIRRRH